MDELTILVRALCHAANARACDLRYNVGTGKWRVEIVSGGVLLSAEGEHVHSAMLAVSRKIGDQNESAGS